MRDLRATLPIQYTRHGYEVRDGAGYAALAQCHALWCGDKRLDTGLGVSWVDLDVFAKLATTFTPAMIFGIGNGFGWSTIALRMLWPEAWITVLDAETEGVDNAETNRLTRRIMAELGQGEIVPGSSPRDVSWVLQGPPPAGLCFIDGCHTNDQQTADFDAVRPFLAPEHIVFFHDVVLCDMTRSWRSIAAQYPGQAKILDTPTGMGCVWTGDIGAAL